MVIERAYLRCESVKEDADIFVLADLSAVWVEVTVYAEGLNVVKAGQTVTVKSDVLGVETDGILTYLGHSSVNKHGLPKEELLCRTRRVLASRPLCER